MLEPRNQGVVAQVCLLMNGLDQGLIIDKAAAGNVRAHGVQFANAGQRYSSTGIAAALGHHVGDAFAQHRRREGVKTFAVFDFEAQRFLLGWGTGIVENRTIAGRPRAKFLLAPMPAGRLSVGKRRAESAASAGLGLP